MIEHINIIRNLNNDRVKLIKLTLLIQYIVYYRNDEIRNI